uniref:Uncharacterized protein n=1 Tax=Cucumis melo TaxID=3656 RepID=A0A9I9ED12_CUCME
MLLKSLPSVLTKTSQQEPPCRLILYQKGLFSSPRSKFDFPSQQSATEAYILLDSRKIFGKWISKWVFSKCKVQLKVTSPSIASGQQNSNA